MLQIMIAAIIFVLLQFSGPRQCQAQTESEIRDYLNSQIRQYNLPSAAAAVITSKSIVSAAVGTIKQDGGNSVTVSSRYHIGSNTKAITAHLALIAVQEGLLSWHSKPVDIFAELKHEIHPKYSEITLKGLLVHRAGIPPYNLVGAFDSVPDFEGSVVERRRQFMIWQLRQDSPHETGEFLYSNVGYDFAAAMIEEVSGKSWRDLVTRHVFIPFKLENSGFGWPNTVNINEPWGHWKEFTSDTTVLSLGPDYFWKLPDIDEPSGNIHMSINDFARYVQLHLIELNDYDDVVKGLDLKILHEPVGDYAFGWNVRQVYGTKCSFHNGSGGTFFAEMLINHDNGNAVVAAVNSGLPEAARLCRKIVTRYMFER